MASALFAFFIVAPLFLLGLNLGRGAVGSAARFSETRGLRGRRPRPQKSPWPVRARRVLPAVDPARSIAPLAVLRRMCDARRTDGADATPSPTAGVVFSTVPIELQPVVLPVTASARGFVPAPASAFTAGPALRPRHGPDRVLAA